MFNDLEKLCLLNAISGREDEVRNYLIGKISNFDDCKYFVDPLGNLIVDKKGEKSALNKVMIAAHMDEVGMIVTYITDDGFIKFGNVGGINTAVIVGKQVKINDVYGVVGVKPIHLLSKKDEKDLPSKDEMYIDIGAENREEAEKYIKLGDSITFVSDYLEFGDDMIKGKALDDRLGCAVMLKMLSEPAEYDFTCLFSVQEEIGCRGAKVAATRIAPDYAIVLECTTASDIEGVSGDKEVCNLGKGAVVSFMDGATIYDRELYKLAFDIAGKKNIKVQTKTLIAGGNDASEIHKSAGGVKTLAVSVPCRYLHSPSCVIKKEDAISVKKLVSEIVGVLAND